MKVKKWLSIVLALSFVFAILACDGDSDDKKKGKRAHNKDGNGNGNDGGDTEESVIENVFYGPFRINNHWKMLKGAKRLGLMLSANDLALNGWPVRRSFE